MIRIEIYGHWKDGTTLIRTWSDLDMMIRQVESGTLYEEAIDVEPVRYTYEETDVPIPDDVSTAEEIVEILMGGAT